MADYVFKRGDTFSVSRSYLDRTGAPQSLDGVTGTSELRDAQDQLVAVLAWTPVAGQPGVYMLSYNGDTSAWPSGLMRTDVRLVFPDGTIRRTKTVRIVVSDGVTR